jgi:hypothetical protein
VNDAGHGGSPFPFGDFWQASFVYAWQQYPIWLSAAVAGTAIITTQLWRDWAERRTNFIVQHWTIVLLSTAAYILGWMAKPKQSLRYQGPVIAFMALLAVVPLASLWRRSIGGRILAIIFAGALLVDAQQSWRVDEVSREEAANQQTFVTTLQQHVGENEVGLVYGRELRAMREPFDYLWSIRVTYWFLRYYTGQQAQLIDPRNLTGDVPQWWLALMGAPVDALLDQVGEEWQVTEVATCNDFRLLHVVPHQKPHQQTDNR